MCACVRAAAGGAPSDAFAAYIRQRDYSLLTLQARPRRVLYLLYFKNKFELQMCWKRRLARRLATATHPAAACASAAHLTSPAAASPPLPRLAQEYGALLSEAGFDSVAALDRTEEFRGHLARELAAAEGDRQGWVAAFSQEDYEEVGCQWRCGVCLVFVEGAYVRGRLGGWAAWGWGAGWTAALSWHHGRARLRRSGGGRAGRARHAPPAAPHVGQGSARESVPGLHWRRRRARHPAPALHAASQLPTATSLYRVLCRALYRPQVTGSWRFKLDRVAAGELQWGLFRAFKQMSGRDYHEPEAPGDGFAALA